MTKSLPETIDSPATEAPAEKPDEIQVDELTRQAGRALFWQLSGGVGYSVIRLGASTVLARLLMPEDFGILGLAVLVAGILVAAGAIQIG